MSLMAFCLQTIFITALFIGAYGLRSAIHSKKRAKLSIRQTLPGKVDEVWNIGGPAPFRDPIENPRGGGCFPGIRMWTWTDEWYGMDVDYAPFLTLPFGYWHALQEGMAINSDDGTVKRHGCNRETADMPWGVPVDMHAVWSEYIEPTQNQSDHFRTVLNVGVRNHDTHNLTVVRARAAAYGWDLVHSAFDEGGDVLIGYQVSHLFQHPTTRECILTFQGVNGIKDGASTPLLVPVDFCGLPSKAHFGFVDGMREIMNNTDFQQNIRSQLPTCSKVYTAGHSLGGAKATLFAACANQLLQPGDDGYDDYKYVTWEATPVCSDLNDACAYWASLDYCSTESQYHPYMMNNCCASCDASCTDKNDSCGYWAGLGYCGKASEFHPYMTGNCCASCGFHTR